MEYALPILALWCGLRMSAIQDIDDNDGSWSFWEFGLMCLFVGDIGEIMLGGHNKLNMKLKGYWQWYDMYAGEA